MHMPIRLHVNIDHVATVRNARGGRYPDPVEAAFVCERAGAEGITVHLRIDRRHIIDRDIERLRESVSTLINLEMAATDEMVEIACRNRPEIVTLVPERVEERTTEGGLNVVEQRAALGEVIRRLRDAGIKPSCFVAADEAQIEAAHALGAELVELHTGDYSAAAGDRRIEQAAKIATAATFASRLGLEVAAGHGLTRHNVAAIASIPEIVELNIGHAIVSDAIFMGLDAAVREMRAAMDRGVLLRPMASQASAR